MRLELLMTKKGQTVYLRKTQRHRLVRPLFRSIIAIVAPVGDRLADSSDDAEAAALTSVSAVRSSFLATTSDT